MTYKRNLGAVKILKAPVAYNKGTVAGLLAARACRHCVMCVLRAHSGGFGPEQEVRRY
jgi:hypothetical protein